ncbi:Protein of unknown function [Lentibacillus persicus]|uniref:DUF2953 domain-containing protein n=1 Tax=Lentibacillus persicus TaxID=640948 RepID=A0A1I1TRB0_9BACI|nr:DUF2953 domain-containing protein [Lentibacillus persicus]SFD61137.1 Protein of unknown function [Lentibacillus persicus]
MVLGLICVVAVIVLLAVILLRLKIECSIILDNNQQTLWLAVYYFRIRIFERTVDLSEETKDQNQSIEETLAMLHKMSKNFVQWLRSFQEISTIILGKLRFETLSWRTEVGLGNAHTTGIATGGVWSVKGMAMGLLLSKSHFYRKPALDVVPLFNQKQIESKVNCMISIRTGQAIVALLKIIQKYPKNQEATI